MTTTVKGTVVVDQVRCKGCNLCAVACPTGTLAMHPTEINDKGYHFSYMATPDTCIAAVIAAWYAQMVVSPYTGLRSKENNLIKRI